MDEVSLLESLISPTGGNLDEARRVLRKFLLKEAGSSIPSATVGDALAALARQPLHKSAAAVVLLRSLAVTGLVPEPNSSNQIIRSTVDLCEGAIPEIVNFLKIDGRAQNYE